MKTNIICALALFALASITRAVDPPPDGGYRGHNTAEGNNALFSLTTGTDNTALGFDALYRNTTGFNNTATGYLSLSRNTTGSENTAVGWIALVSNTTGGSNTAVGKAALFNNTIGGGNTALGWEALANNTTGGGNTGLGAGALGSNNGIDNTAIGSNALGTNLTGSLNTATGFDALAGRGISGNNNTATGAFALQKNKGGDNNTAVGVNALLNNVSGGNNIALGASAGANLTFGGNNIDIGNEGVAGERKTIRIGRKATQQATFIAGIRGTTTASMDAVPVVIDSEGQLGTVSSSARFKDEIKPMDKASETILGLKPVTFHYKSDSQGTPQFGLIAEEVAKMNSDLVVRDEKGEIYTVRYDAVNAMLLNEFLKEHGKVEELEKDLRATIAQQQNEIKALTARLKEQTAQIRKVTRLRRVEVSRSAPQMVADKLMR